MSKPKPSNQRTARQPAARTHRDQPKAPYSAPRGGNQKPFGRPEGEAGRGAPRQGGDRPAYGGSRDDDRRPSGPRGEGGFSRGPKPFGDRAPRQGGDRPAFGGPRDGGDRRPSGPRGEGGFSRGPKPFGDRAPRQGGDRPAYGGPRGDGDFNRGPKPYGDRPPRQGGDRPAFGAPRDGGDRRPSGPRSDSGFGRGPKPFGDRAPRQGGDRPAYGGPRDGGDRRPSGPRGDSDFNRGPKPYGDRPPRQGGDRPAYAGPRDGGDRRPSGPRGDSDFNRGPKPYGDRPPRQGGDRPAYGGPRDGGDRRPSGPRGEGGFSRGPKPFGDRAPRQGGDRPAYAGPRDGGEGNAYRGPKAGNGGPAASRPGSYLPVLRAKKMPQRHLSGKLEQKMLKLRETRIDPNKGLHEMRLQKALALMGLGSRRDMDEMITQGRVSVNGEVAEPGTRVVPGDKVRVDGRQLAIRWPDRLPRVIVYHKQEGEIVTRDDPEGRVTVFERLPQTRSSKWVAVGRLDVNTSGLLIFTTSGELANRMTHPSFEVDREYAVRTLGALTPDQMKESTRDIELEDGPARFQFIREEDDKEESANHWYRVGLREGRNREVRRLFEHFGLTVSRLIRVRFGIVTLPSRLKRGQFYELNELEVAKLVQWAGLTLAGTSDDA